MRVRPAVAADGPVISHVHVSSRAEAYGPEFAGPSERDYAGALLVAEHEDVVIGFAAVDDGLLGALYVLPGAQGGGAGVVLLRMAMKEGGAERLWVYSANAGARRLYERLGWVAEPETEMTGEDWHPRSPALRYRLSPTAEIQYRNPVPK